MSVKHIHKLQTATVEPTRCTLRLAQVGDQPLAVPCEIDLRWDQWGNFHVDWRWLPGDDASGFGVGARAEVGFTIKLLIDKLMASRPWGHLLPQSKGDAE